MDWFLDSSFSVRLTAVVCLALLQASLVNLAIYAFSWETRLISPWMRRHEKASPRSWADFLPIIGWIRLRREEAVFGKYFWVRPLTVEILTAAAIGFLYWWEVEQLALYNKGIEAIPYTILYAQFLSHALLVDLMMVASMIDVDERLIPDKVTVPGTLLGLLLATLLPWSLLPQATIASVPPPISVEAELRPPVKGMLQSGFDADPNPRQKKFYLEFLKLNSPNPWPQELSGKPNLKSLLLGIGCFWLWCFAMMHRPWYPRHGIGRAIRILSARMARYATDLGWLGLAILGTSAIAATWSWGSESAWAGLLTALVGMVGAGGIVWIVRIIGAFALRKEAMGFGDVMLMMMVGTFVGWQAGLMIFFLAPFAGLLVGVLQLVLRKDNTIPYGPFLCLASYGLILFWHPLWTWGRSIFSVSWMVPAILTICMSLLALILLAMRLVREFFSRA